MSSLPTINSNFMDSNFKQAIQWMIDHFLLKSDCRNASLKGKTLTVIRNYNRKECNILIDFSFETFNDIVTIHATLNNESYNYINRHINISKFIQNSAIAHELVNQIWYCKSISGYAKYNTFTNTHKQANMTKIKDILQKWSVELGFIVKDVSYSGTINLTLHIDTLLLASNPHRTLTVKPYGSVGYQLCMYSTISNNNNNNDITDIISRVLYRDSSNYELLILQFCCTMLSLVPHI